MEDLNRLIISISDTYGLNEEGISEGLGRRKSYLAEVKSRAKNDPENGVSDKVMNLLKTAYPATGRVNRPDLIEASLAVLTDRVSSLLAKHGGTSELVERELIKRDVEALLKIGGKKA